MKNIFPRWLLVLFLCLAAFWVYNTIYEPTPNSQSNSKLPGTEQQQPISPQPNQSGNIDKSQVQAAPNFTLNDLYGKAVSLSDYKGKNIYLNFWASWCGPCRLEMPDIEKIYQAYKDKDLVVLAVNIGESKDEVKTFMDMNQFKFSVLLDTNGTASKIYKVSSIPVSIFVNKEGVIIGKQIGLMTYSQMESYLNELYK